MKKAFTLIEVLIVVAIIVLLIALMIPVFRNGVSNTSSEFDGCISPKVVGTTPTKDPISGYSEVEYLYECNDGRQIASKTKPQELNLRWGEPQPK
jgi:prepilin-type N-terminal cleavage/methylation domain-containing protein